VRRKLGTYLMWVAILGMVSACGFTDEQREYTLVGAAAGAAIGGGIGAGVFAADNSDNWPAIPAGVVGGALIGGIIGYLLAPPPPPPPAPPPEKIVLRGVHFNFDKYYIRNVDKPVLDEAADTLKANPNVKVYVNGYCDAIGSAPYNLKLSQKRAESVAAYLEDKGIPASQLIPQGFGKTNFVATNKTAEGRAENRRVELVPADQ